MRLKGWVKQLLTRRVLVRPQEKRRKLELEEEPPSERLILITEFSIVAIMGLTVIEVVHITVLGVWNNEVFAAITGLIGTITGIVIGSKA